MCAKMHVFVTERVNLGEEKGIFEYFYIKHYFINLDILVFVVVFSKTTSFTKSYPTSRTTERSKMHWTHLFLLTVVAPSSLQAKVSDSHQSANHMGLIHPIYIGRP